MPLKKKDTKNIVSIRILKMFVSRTCLLRFVNHMSTNVIAATGCDKGFHWLYRASFKHKNYRVISHHCIWFVWVLHIQNKKLRENSKVGTQLLLAEIEIRKPWIFCGKKGGKLTTDEHHFIISYSTTCFPSAKISFSSLFFGRGGGRDNFFHLGDGNLTSFKAGWKSDTGWTSDQKTEEYECWVVGWGPSK